MQRENVFVKDLASDIYHFFSNSISASWYFLGSICGMVPSFFRWLNFKLTWYWYSPEVREIIWPHLTPEGKTRSNDIRKREAVYSKD